MNYSFLNCSLISFKDIFTSIVIPLLFLAPSFFYKPNPVLSFKPIQYYFYCFASLFLIFIFIVNIKKVKGYKIYFQKYDILVITFLIYLWVNTIVRHTFWLKSDSLLKITFLFLLYFIGRNWFKKYLTQEQHFRNLISCFQITGAIHLFAWILNITKTNSQNGLFENTAIFSDIILTFFPISLAVILFYKKKDVWKSPINILSFFNVVLIFFATIYTHSRAAIVALIFCSIAMLLLRILQKFRHLLIKKLFKMSIIVIAVLVSFLSIIPLYGIKKNSADGRIFILKISCTIIKDFPVFGAGLNQFKAIYGHYQAKYFETTHPQKAEIRNADNTKIPFNDYVKITIELGVVGLSLVLVLLCIQFAIVPLAQTGTFRDVVKIGFYFNVLIIFILAVFSYPLEILPIVISLLFSCSYLNSESKHTVKITKGMITLLYSILTIFLGYIFYRSYTKVSAYNDWKMAYESYAANPSLSIALYAKTYPSLLQNEYFLYNYGVILFYTNQFDKSFKILQEASQLDYDTETAIYMAEDAIAQGKYQHAIQILTEANNMVPNRFLTKYKIMDLYDKLDDSKNQFIWAEKIVQMDIKIPSEEVSFIKMKAKEILQRRK